MPTPTTTFTAGLNKVIMAYESDDGRNYQISVREGWSDVVIGPSGVDPRTLPKLPKGSKPRMAHLFTTDTTVTPNKRIKRNYPLATRAAVVAFANGTSPLVAGPKDGFTWGSLGWTGEKRRKLDANI